VEALSCLSGTGTTPLETDRRTPSRHLEISRESLGRVPTEESPAHSADTPCGIGPGSKPGQGVEWRGQG